MPDATLTPGPVRTIAAKDIRDALRDRFIPIVTAILGLAAMVALVPGGLTLVLIAPQIRDTLDPDNQVAGGVFKQVNIARPDRVQIMKGFATYETPRDGIEQASVTKHFGWFTFAVLGIKAMYSDMPPGPIPTEIRSNLILIFLTALGLGDRSDGRRHPW